MAGQPSSGKVKTSKTVDKFWNRVAWLLTNLLAPPFVAAPTLTILALEDYERHGSVFDNGLSLMLALTFGITFPILLIIFLRLTHRITNVHIPVREERTLPFILTIGSFVFGFFLVWLITGGGLLAALMFSYAVNSGVGFFVNCWWKISVHALGVASPAAAFTVVAGWWALPFYILIPLVCWSRVHLKAHTTAQVIAGSILGYSFTLFEFLAIFHNLGWF